MHYSDRPYSKVKLLFISPEKLFILAAKCVLANAQVLFRIITDDTNDDEDDMCISGKKNN